MSGRSRGLLSVARSRTAMLSAGLVLAFCTHAARAQSPAPAGSPTDAPALAWSGPGPELTCLGEEGLARAVNEYLGREAFASASVELVLHVDLERLADRTWRAALTLVDRSGRVLGRRDLTSGSDLCSSLDEPLVLAVALMVDSEPEPPPPPTPPAEAPPEAEPEPEPPASPPEEAHRTSSDARWPRFQADLSVALEAGLLPAARPGVGAGAELLAASWFSARLSALGFVPAEAELASDASVRFALLGGALELCPSVGDPSGFRGSLCLGALYGALHAASRGLASGKSTWEALLGVSVGARAQLPLGRRWGAVAGAAAVLPYHPNRFVYVENGRTHELFRVASPSLLATLGAWVTF